MVPAHAFENSDNPVRTGQTASRDIAWMAFVASRRAWTRAKRALCREARGRVYIRLRMKAILLHLSRVMVLFSRVMVRAYAKAILAARVP